MLDSIEFVKALYNSPIPLISIENPVGLLSSRWRKPDQIIQPYMFGDEATKTTCLWNKGLPLLKATNIVGKGERTVFASGKSHPAWYADALKNSKTKAERQTLRSKTFPGIANPTSTSKTNLNLGTTCVLSRYSFASSWRPFTPHLVWPPVTRSPTSFPL